jgi:hypothetical protein
MRIPRRFAFAVFIAAVCNLAGASPARAQVFELVASFVGCTPEGCPDGGDSGIPAGPLLAGADGFFYGALVDSLSTERPPQWAIYRVDTTGHRLILHRFTGEGENGCFVGSLTIGADGALYGVAGSCGTDSSTIFRIVGTAFEVVQTFPSDGTFRPGSLFAGPGNAFYGVGTDTSSGASQSVVFRWDGIVEVLGPARGNLFDLTSAEFVKGPDGNLYVPLGLYHSTFGASGGAILRVTADQQVETVYEFPRGSEAPSSRVFLVGSDGNLYGLAEQAGFEGQGPPARPYRLTLAGNFTYLTMPEGATPLAAGVDGSVLFMSFGTPSGDIHRLSAGGVSTLVHTFDGTDGSPSYRLTQGFDGHFYGVSATGGAHGLGVFYRIRMPSVDVEANGSDDPITIAPGSPLEISISLDAAPATTIETSEVYVAVVTPALQVLWMNPSGGFSATPTRLYAGPLMAFGPLPIVTIPDVSSLAAGDYYWVTIIDTDNNGVPNGAMLDFVKTTRGG